MYHHCHQISAKTTCLAAGVAALAAVCAPVSAQVLASDVPREMEGVGITERLNERVPMDLEFIDASGEVVTLGQFFEQGKPVILTLNYYNCPMLCHLTLNGLVAGLKDVALTAGEDFQVVTVSINPTETPDLAAAFRDRYLRDYAREGADWHFLCDKDGNAQKLADAVGYGYRFVPETGEYAHSSSIQFITPDGRISRYMNDVVFEGRDLRFALVESSQGAIGTPMDRVLLFTCFQYDPNSNSYAPAAWKVMRSGGALTVIFVGVGLLVLWKRGSVVERANRAQGRGSSGLATASGIGGVS